MLAVLGQTTTRCEEIGSSWIGNFKALVRGKKIPDPGTSWLWTDAQPTLNRGICPEAVAAVLRNGSTVSELISPADQRRLLQFPELVANGDVLGIERATGFVVRMARLQELQVTIEEEARVATALHGRKVSELRRRLKVGDCGVALPAAPQEPMLLLVSHPPVYALPLALGSVPGDHPSVVFAAAPLPAERGWGSADGGAASPEEQRGCKLNKVSQNTQPDKNRSAKNCPEGS